MIRMESVDLGFSPPSLPGGWLGGGREEFEGIVWGRVNKWCVPCTSST